MHIYMGYPLLFAVSIGIVCGAEESCIPHSIYHHRPKTITSYARICYTRHAGSSEYGAENAVWKADDDNDDKSDGLELAQIPTFVTLKDERCHTSSPESLGRNHLAAHLAAMDSHCSSTRGIYESMHSYFNMTPVLKDLESVRDGYLKGHSWPRRRLVEEVRSCQPCSTAPTMIFIVIGEDFVYELNYDPACHVTNVNVAAGEYRSGYVKSTYGDFIAKHSTCFYALNESLTVNSLREVALSQVSSGYPIGTSKQPLSMAHEIFDQGLLDGHPLKDLMAKVVNAPNGWEMIHATKKRGIFGIDNTAYLYIRPNDDDATLQDELVYHLSELCGMNASFVKSAVIALNESHYTLSEHQGILPVDISAKAEAEIPTEHMDALYKIMSSGANIWSTLSSLVHGGPTLRTPPCPFWSEHTRHIRTLYNGVDETDFENMSFLSSMIGGGDLHDANFIIQYDPDAQRLRVKNIDYDLYFVKYNFMFSRYALSLPEHPAFSRPLANVTETIRRLESIDIGACQQLLQHEARAGSKSRAKSRGAIFDKVLNTVIQVLKSNPSASLTQLTRLMHLDLRYL